MPKITPKSKKPGRDNTERKVIVAHTTDKGKMPLQSYQWWRAQNDNDLCYQVIATANYLQKTQQYRVKGASIFSRIYSGKGLMNYALNSKILDTSNQLPVRRPTMNVTQGCVDTLVSRLTQSRPRPVFLTEDGDYRERHLADQFNSFTAGEFFRMKAYDLGARSLHDSCIFGDGLIKVFEKNKKVALERTLATEVFADKDDSWYGDPRQLIQLKLSDRAVVAAMFPDAKLDIGKAVKAYVDGSGESSETVSDQIILAEAWHLPSCEGADDGRHVIVCSAGPILDEAWEKDSFPFVKMPFSPHAVGWFSQGLVEQLMGTQLGIDQILRTISEAMNVVGVPRVFMDELSKILETSINNNVGSIIKFRGSPPIFHTAESNAPDVYEHLMRLISFAYQISGISALAAASQKPAGLNSGEAIRSYDDLQSDRFAALAKRYDNMYVELAYQVMDVAKDIADRDGEYTTVFPNKDGTRVVELPKADILKDTYVIQCYDESSLPRDPAGRYARLSEMLASGEITLEEFRSLSSFPDLKQSDKLANALRNRILKTLDDIVQDGTPPEVDPFLLDPTGLAEKLAVNYINIYSTTNIKEERLQMIRDFLVEIQTLKLQATPPPASPNPEQAGGSPTPLDPNAQPAPAPPPTPMSAVSQAA